MIPAPYGRPIPGRPFGASADGTLGRVDPCPTCGRTFSPEANAWHHRSHLEACQGPKRPRGRPGGLPGETLARIESLYAGGMGLRAIARLLTSEGVATADGGQWHASTVRATLLRRQRDPHPALSDLPD